ncbi:hypothetical protein AVEN_225556-1 [Araneus ventricosus]|uniref:Uncharacterized protein n=1 Tax=Araneus ventricosus TaxID=182803 RepID=A0A4Y2UW07_ARAVE|nr:hypothetical protein AVEN_225556-1 [Araneus ventricosus]
MSVPALGKSFTTAPRNANPSRTCHSYSLPATIPPLAFKTRTPAGSDFLSERLPEVHCCVISHSRDCLPPNVCTPVVFPHLWPGSPNGAYLFIYGLAVQMERISSFMAWQSKWSVFPHLWSGSPNGELDIQPSTPDLSNFHRFFTLTNRFGVEQSNLRRVERS